MEKIHNWQKDRKRLEHYEIRDIEAFDREVASGDALSSLDPALHPRNQLSRSGLKGRPLVAETAKRAYIYANIHPDYNTPIAGVPHDWVHVHMGLLRTGKLKAYELYNLENRLYYRLHKINAAAKILRDMGINFVKYETFDLRNWLKEKVEGAGIFKQDFFRHLEQIHLPVDTPSYKLLCETEWNRPEQWVAAAYCEAGIKPTTGDYYRGSIGQSSFDEEVGLCKAPPSNMLPEVSCESDVPGSERFLQRSEELAKFEREAFAAWNSKQTSRFGGCGWKYC